MTGTGLPNFDHAVQSANTWLVDVAKATGDEEDRHRAYRLLRAWLHTLRDRLPTDVVAHLGAQLPTLVRGVFYEGWDPHPTPAKFDRQEYLDRFGHEASLPAEDAEDAVRAVTGAVFLHIPPEQLEHVFDTLPHDLRSLVTPAA